MRTSTNKLVVRKWAGLSLLLSSLLLTACDNSDSGTVSSDVTGDTELVFSPPAALVQSRIASADLILEILVDGTPVPLSRNDLGQWVGTTMVPSNSNVEVVVNWAESFEDDRLPNNMLPLATATKELNVAPGATSAQLTFLNNEFDTFIDNDLDGRSNLAERNDNFDPLSGDSPGVPVITVPVRIELALPASLSNTPDAVKQAIFATVRLNGNLVTLTRQADRWSADESAAENSSVFVSATFYDSSQQGARLAVVQRSQDITDGAVVSFVADDYADTFDDDSDGLSNAAEITAGSNPKDSNSPAREPCDISQFTIGCLTDTDGDGDPDSQETASADSDGDGRPNYQESSQVDADGDGRSAEADADDGNACIPTVNVAACQDTLDGDGDGTPNGEDNCPIDANADQADADGDDIGDVCDPTPGTSDTTAPTWTGGGSVSVTNETPTTLGVSWSGATDDTAVTGYVVSYTSGGTTDSVTSVATSAMLTGLSEQTSYTITVEALDAATNTSITGPSVVGMTTETPVAADTTAPTWTGGGSVSVTNETPTTLDVSWSGATDDTAVTSYVVSYTGGGTTDSVTSVATSAMLTGLSEQTSYTITVEALDAATNTSITGPSVVGMTTETPVAADTTAPTWTGGGSVSVTNETPTTLGVSWSGATDDTAVTGYVVSYTSGGTTDSVTSVATSAMLTGLSEQTSYTITVEALDAATNTSITGPSVVGMTTETPVAADTTAPTWTGGGAVSVTNETPTTLGVSWSGATDDTAVTGYVVSYTGGGTTDSVTSVATSATLIGLSELTSYTITVEAVDAASNTSTDGPSGAGNTTAAADTAAPTWTGGGAVSVTNETPTTLDVSWSGATDDTAVTSYVVSYTGGGTTDSVTSVATSATLIGLSELTSYTITVEAVDAASNTSTDGPSGAGSTTAAADTTAPTWTGGGAVSVTNETPTTLDVSWSGATDDTAVTSYVVSYTGGGTTDSVTSVATSATLIGLSELTSYTITVEAVDAASNTSTDGPSGAGSTTAAADTTAPTWTGGGAVSVTNETPTTLDVSWSGATDDTAVTSYVVSYTGGGTTDSVTSVATSATLIGLSELTSYTITVEAVDAASNTSTDGPSGAGSTTAAADTTAPTWAGAGVITLANETSTSMDISWTGVATDDTAVTSYVVIYTVGGNTSSVANATAPVSLTGLTPMTSYTIRVQAMDAAANTSTDGPVAIGLTT